MQQEISEDLPELLQKLGKTAHILTENFDMAESLSNEKCNGIMGVPITFLDKYNPDQFEIMGQLNVGCYMDENGWQGAAGKNMLAIGEKTVYKRILIRRKVNEN